MSIGIHSTLAVTQWASSFSGQSLQILYLVCLKMKTWSQIYSKKVHTQYFREIGPIVKIIVCTSADFFFLELGLVSAFTTESIAKFISAHCL